MKKLFNLCMAATLLGATGNAAAMESDDPILTMVKIDQLELRKTAGTDPIVLDGYAWVGKDLDKLWIKFDAEKVGAELEELETQFLYSHAVAPFWDFQVGWRRDNKPASETRDWLAVGFNGVAPYLFDVDAQLFIGENGRAAARFNAEYELMFTQKLVLVPEFEVNAYSKSDPARGLGSGLSDTSLGLRLAYHIKREFAPYVGVNWDRKYGGTADYARATGEPRSDTQWVLGISAWF
jgi:copper resistance protein B